MKELKNNLIKDIEDKIHYPTLDDISITDKEGEDLPPELQESFKKVMEKYWNHPKFQEYTKKIFFNVMVYGEAFYNVDDLDNIIKEIDES